MLIAVGARMDDIFCTVNAEWNQTATHEKAGEKKKKKERKALKHEKYFKNLCSVYITFSSLSFSLPIFLIFW